MLCFCFGEASLAATPGEALAKAKKAISGASSLTADFSLKAQGNTVKGKILSKGKKFAVNTNSTSSWYNGTDLYTYQPSKSETTIFRPTATELAEVNPLLYINTADNFKVLGTKAKKAGVESIVLMPKNTSSGIKSVTIDLDSKTFLPKMLTIVPSSGGNMVVTISSIKLNSNIPDSSFNYPKQNYPKAKLIDMR